MRHAPWCAILLSLLGCVEELEPLGVSEESHVVSFDIPGTVPADLDVVFAIDDSVALAPYLDRVSEVAAEFDASLRQLPFRVQRHVDVVTTSGNHRGSLVDELRPDGERVTNFTGTFTEALGALLATETPVDAPARPLAAIEQAFANPNTVHPYGYLMVVTISARDDQSPGAPSDYARIVRLAKASWRTRAVGVYPPGAVRLDAFHDSLEVSNTALSIDAESYFDALGWPMLPEHPIASPCIAEPADRDPLAEGIQRECTISVIDDDARAETAVPSCAATDEPSCWHLGHDPVRCPSAVQPATIEIRGYTAYRPHVRGQCVVR